MDLADRKFLEKLTKVTEENLSDEAFGVTQLAREMGISRSLLYRKVKTLTNRSISQFLREQRLQKAMELLRENSLNISEIAFATGFGSVAYFSRCFHQLYGYQPNEARKRMTGEAVTQNREDDNSLKEAQEAAGTTSPVKRQISKKHFVVWPVGVLISSVIILSIFLLNSSPDNSIGILPFENHSSDPANDYFNDGIAEAIRDRLANIRDLEVKSRMTTDSYKNINDKPMKRIAREMRVRYIVEGSSQKSGNVVLITVQLIDARNDIHLFSRQYEEKYTDVFSLYGRIALEVAEEIRAVITPEEKKLMKEPFPGNLEALKQTIKGQDLLSWSSDRAKQNLEFRNQAEISYRKALELDSTNSDAMTGLARICYYKHDFDSALFLADKALHYNFKNANAYLLKSEVYIDSREPSEAEKNLRLALKYDPQYARAYHLLGGICYSRGEFYKAVEYLLKTGKLLGSLDPASSHNELFQAEWNTLRLSRTLFALGFYEEGRKYARQWLKLSSDSTSWGYYYNLFLGGIINGKFEEVYQLGLTIPYKDLCLYYMGLNLLFMGQYSEALEYFLKIPDDKSLNGRYYHRIYHLEAFAYLKSGDQSNAEKYFRLSEYYVDTLLAAHPNYIKTENTYAIMDRYWRSPLFIRAANAAARGEKEKALGTLRELRKNYPASDLQVVTFLKLFPMFDNIRHEPEFRDYLMEAENHYLSERRKVEKLLKEEGIIE